MRRALLDARDTVFILGWDTASTVDLEPGGDTTEAPTRLDELIAFVSKRRPQLRCYILTWDYGSVYTLEREPLTRWRLRWRVPRRVRFGFDDHHPVGASHHQKIIVVDDQLAFCGSIDLTSHRWDTTAHNLEEPARKTVLGRPYDPYHEVQLMVSGPVATSLGAAGARSLARGGIRAPAGARRIQHRVVAGRGDTRSDGRRCRHRAHRPAIRRPAGDPGMRDAVS